MEEGASPEGAGTRASREASLVPALRQLAEVQIQGDALLRSLCSPGAYSAPRG